MSRFRDAALQSFFILVHAVYILWQLVSYCQANPDIFKHVAAIVGWYLVIGFLLLLGTLMHFFGSLVLADDISCWCKYMLGERSSFSQWESFFVVLFSSAILLAELGIFAAIYINSQANFVTYIVEDRQGSYALWLLYYFAAGLHLLFAAYVAAVLWFLVALWVYSGRLVRSALSSGERDTVLRIRKLSSFLASCLQ